MNRQELIGEIKKILDRKELSFFKDGEKAMDRFDNSERKKESEDDFVSDTAFLLFKWISAAVFAKAKGPCKGKSILPVFESLLDKLGLSEEEKDKARKILNDFVLWKMDITNHRLISVLLPFAVEREIKGHLDDEKKIRKDCSKNEEVLFNQVNLFTQSLFRCFLLKDTLDPESIRSDFDNLSSGIVSYHKKRIIPTISGSYSLASFKDEVLKGIKQASDSYPFETIDTVRLFYPSIGLSIGYPLPFAKQK